MNNKNFNVVIFALIAGMVLISGCLTSETQKGTLEITVMSSTGEPESGAEVRVWSKDNFDSDPKWKQSTGQDGVTLFDLSPGIYIVGLSSGYYGSTDEAKKNVVYIEVKADETVKKTLTVPKDTKNPEETKDDKDIGNEIEEYIKKEIGEEGSEKEEEPEENKEEVKADEEVSEEQKSGESEEVDSETFNKYFSNMQIGKMPMGKQLKDVELDATVFASGSNGDFICLYTHSIKSVQLTVAYYNTKTDEFVSRGFYDQKTKNYVGRFVFQPLTARYTSTSCVQIFGLPNGEYEFRVYAEDKLIASFPFEIR